MAPLAGSTGSHSRHAGRRVRPLVPERHRLVSVYALLSVIGLRLLSAGSGL